MPSRLFFVVAALILVPVELLCAESSLETQGEVLQMFLRLMVGVTYSYTDAFAYSVGFSVTPAIASDVT
jgi:hypothetical protein